MPVRGAGWYVPVNTSGKTRARADWFRTALPMDCVTLHRKAARKTVWPRMATPYSIGTEPGFDRLAACLTGTAAAGLGGSAAFEPVITRAFGSRGAVAPLARADRNRGCRAALLFGHTGSRAAGNAFATLTADQAIVAGTLHAAVACAPVTGTGRRRGGGGFVFGRRRAGRHRGQANTIPAGRSARRAADQRVRTAGVLGAGGAGAAGLQARTQEHFAALDRGRSAQDGGGVLRYPTVFLLGGGHRARLVEECRNGEQGIAGRDDVERNESWLLLHDADQALQSLLGGVDCPDIVGIGAHRDETIGCRGGGILGCGRT